MSHLLNIRGSAGFDDSISSIQHHSYNPYTTSYNNCDEIRIVVQQQDLYLFPHDSYLYIEGKFDVDAASADKERPDIINNGISFTFDEIRYELNGFEIDKCKNTGITSLIKGYLSFEPNDMFRMEIAGWEVDDYQKANAGVFNYCIPLKNLFGFAEDYKNIIMNAKHELILIRSRSDVNAFHGTHDNVKFNISKIQWRVPHVQVSDAEKLKLLKFIDKKQTIQMVYRSWELYEHPMLPANDKHIWAVKTSTQVNTPRFVVFGFQTNRNNRIDVDKSKFDHCELSDLKIYLNSVCYPYESLNVDFTKNQYAVLYDMYSKFQESYYHDKIQSFPLFTYKTYKSSAPLVVIDCSRQPEALKRSTIDLRIEFQTKQNIPAQTSAYCMIIHDNVLFYSPYTGIVNRMD